MLKGLCCLLLVVVTGCVGQVHPPPPPLPSMNASELLSELNALGQRFSSLAGMAKVEVSEGERTFSLRQVLLAEKPDRLRAEALGPFGQPVLVLTTDGSQLQVSTPRDGKFFSGPATAANFARFTRMPLQVTDLVGLLLVSPPRFAFADTRLVPGTDGWLLTLKGDGEVRQEFSFDRRRRLVRAAYFVGDELQLQAEYAEFEAAQQAFPRSLGLIMPIQQVSAKVIFSEVDVNKPLTSAKFVLTPPAGVAILPLP